MAAQRGLLSGPLAIGLVHPLPGRAIVRTVGAFAREHPAIELRAASKARPTRCSRRSRPGRCTARSSGSARAPSRRRSSRRASSRASRRCSPSIPAHPLAQRETVRVGALRDEPFVTLTHASRLRHVLEAICGAGGLRAAGRRRDQRPRGDADARGRGRRRRLRAALGARRCRRDRPARPHAPVRGSADRARVARGLRPARRASVPRRWPCQPLPCEQRAGADDRPRSRPRRSGQAGGVLRRRARDRGRADPHAAGDRGDPRPAVLGHPRLDRARRAVLGAVDARLRARAVVGVRPRDEVAARARARARRAGRERAAARGRRGRAGDGRAW